MSLASCFANRIRKIKKKNLFDRLAMLSVSWFIGEKKGRHFRINNSVG